MRPPEHRTSDELAADLVVPAGPSPNNCRHCTAPLAPDDEQCCETCALAAATLELESLPQIIPVCWYAKPSPMRDRLMGYKDDPDTQTRTRYRTELAAIATRFFDAHAARIRNQFGSWDFITVVPSSKDRQPPHPLHQTLEQHDSWTEPLGETLTRGEAELGWRTYSKDGYRPSRCDLEGNSILLLEDVFVTGSHCYSAAHALQAAGAKVPAIITIARRINPDYEDIPALNTQWHQQKQESYDYLNVHWIGSL